MIYKFVNGRVGLVTELVNQILTYLRRINSWFNRQKYHRFYSNRIVIAYDALSLLRPGIVSISNSVRVRILNLARAGTVKNIETNRIFRRGLKNLITMFENLNSPYNDMEEQEIEGCSLHQLNNKLKK